MVLLYIFNSIYWHLKYLLDDRCHVVVIVFCEAAAEDDVVFLGCEGAVLVGKTVVAVIVHGIVRLHVCIFGPF